MLKKGQILKRKNGTAEQKILAVVDECYLMSCLDDFTHANHFHTLKDIEDLFIIPKEKWVPEEGERFHYIDFDGVIESGVYVEGDDDIIISFNNCFKTKEEAEQARDKVKELLGGL